MEHDGGAGGDGESVDDAGHGDESDVLAEGGDGSAAEEARYAANESVAADGRSHLVFMRVALEGSVAQG